MPRFSLIRPLDQPLDTHRLLNDLKAALQNPQFTELRFIVAYAKSGPLYRLEDLLRAWRASGKTAEVILGIDQQGTSQDALELALSLFGRVYVTQEGGITFHPKIYLFKGTSHAQAFIGSNNLTVGGTEKNFEAAIKLDLDLPTDATDLQTIESAWNDLLPATCPATKLLDDAELASLVAAGTVIEENRMRSSAGGGDAAVGGTRFRGPRTGLAVRPESPLPRRPAPRTGRPTTPRVGRAATAVTPITAPAAATTARGFAIQIKPHHNGEIFLSVTAALQNPAFFKWPFTGHTTPKKPRNPSYPQLSPDPVVNITVWGAGVAPVLILSGYSLNTVYYANKSEIRITASPLIGVVPDFSVMIMEPSNLGGVDYEITIHRPDSPNYAAWVAACNQTMPGGGQAPRMYGWF